MAAVELRYPMLSFGTVTDTQDEAGRRWVSIPFGRYDGVEMVITPNGDDLAADALAISWPGALPVGFARHFAALGITLFGEVECEIWAAEAPPAIIFTENNVRDLGQLCENWISDAAITLSFRPQGEVASIVLVSGDLRVDVPKRGHVEEEVGIKMSRATFETASGKSMIAHLLRNTFYSDIDAPTVEDLLGQLTLKATRRCLKAHDVARV